MKKSFSAWVIFIITLCFANSAWSQQQPQDFDTDNGASNKYFTVVTPHFRVHYPEDLATLTNEVIDLSETIFEKLTKRMQWTPKGRIHLVLSSRSDQSNGFATVSPYNYIFLYVSPPEANTSLDHYKNYMELLIQHELTHILHIDQHRGLVTPLRLLLGRIVHPNAATPVWMREGMAVYEESMLDEQYGRNNSGYTDMVIRSAVVENEFPRLDQINGLSASFPAGAGPYLFGGQFFEWLAQKYGEDRMYKYQEEYSRTLWLYSLNNKARRVYGKNFKKLWQEFRDDQIQKYTKQKEDLESLGLTSFETQIANRKDHTSLSYFVERPNSTGYAYFEKSLDDGPRLFIYPEADQKPIVVKRSVIGQMSFSKAGRYLAFSTYAGVESGSKHAEVYLYDLKKKKLGRMKDQEHAKKSMHVTDPDWSPVDGGGRWMVMVKQFVDTDQLYIFDALEKRGYVITDELPKTQFSNPRFSPDGNLIVVSRKSPEGQRDILVYNKFGKKVSQITNDLAVDNFPFFSYDGSLIYFSSYKTGVANIFYYDVNTDRVQQVTNVLTGVFQPTLSHDGKKIFVETYSSLGNSIQKMNVSEMFKNRSGFLSYVSHLNSLENINESHKDLSHVSSQTQAWPLEKLYSHAAGSQGYQVATNGNQAVRSVSPQETWVDQVEDNSVYTKNRRAGRELDLDVTKKDSKIVETEEVDSETDEDISKENKTEKSEKTKKATKPSLYKNALQGKPNDLQLPIQHPDGYKKYSPFPQILIPKFVVPVLLSNEDAVLLGLSTGNFDPLNRHAWNLTVNYRTDAGFFGGGAQYVYKRYNPLFFAGAVRYAIDWGRINGQQFFEERNQGYAGISYGIKSHRFSLSYFYEDRDEFTEGVDASLLLNMKPYAGLRFRYTFGKWKRFPYSVSRENGVFFKGGIDYTNEVLGSDDVNEEIVGTADLRFYLEMPWSQHHVLAIRVAGGHKTGDVQQFGVFRLGGAFGEGIGAVQVSSRVFSLRGLPGITFGGDSVFIASGEYRLPLTTKANRGVSTWPIFLDKLSLVFFVDSGDIRYESESADLFSRYLVSPGLELRGNIVIGYGLPLLTRLGYAKVVVNQDRLGTLQDPILGTTVADSGTLYFQVGTSF